MNSYWVKTTKDTNFPSLSENINTDVCIIGAGITGIMTAYYLSKNNMDITILDASKFALGVTANTTAKITSQHGLLYDYLLKSFGKDTAKKYFLSNEEAILDIKHIVDTEKINCDLISQDSYVYTCNKDNVQKILNEVDAINTFGDYAEYVTSSPLPFDIEAGVKLKNQAQFHPRKYLLSIGAILEKRNVKIFENSKVVDIKHTNNHYEVFANNYKVNCKYLVMASHYPIKNFPGMYFIKMYQDSSYVVGVEIDEKIDGMYISCDTPATSFRNIPQDNGKNLLLVGGSSHKTGATDVTIEDSYTNLENYIKTIFPKANVKYRWMTEDCVSLDKIPYIGEFSNFLPNMYVATGFKKWGMTTSHVAARIISDKINGIPNPYEEVYTATRLQPIKNHKEFANMLKTSVYSLAINKINPAIIDFKDLKNDSRRSSKL